MYHNTVVIGDVLYLWAGAQQEFPEVHDSDRKRELTSNIEGFTIRIRTERPSIPSAGMDGISRGGGAINKQY